MADNLLIYNKVREVPAEAQKAFNNGSFSGTDVNPMFRIRCLTETFGPAGFGWYTEEVEHWTENVNNEIAVYVKINLFVKIGGEWSKPILGIGGSKSLQQFKNGPKFTDEAYKMAYTDAISVACKALGVAADVYWNSDPTKYSYSEGAQQGSARRRNVANQGDVAQGGTTAQPSLKDALTRLFNANTYEAFTAIHNTDLPLFNKNAQYIVAYNAKYNELKSKGILQ